MFFIPDLMNKKAFIIFLLFFFSFFPFLFAEETRLPVTIDADRIDFLQPAGKIVAEGNVVITHQEVELFCDEAIYDPQENKAQVIGEAKIIREGTTAYGQDIVYDFDKLKFSVGRVRVSQPPLYGKAEDIEEDQEKYILKDGYITTCNLDEPHYRLVARRVTIYPGERVVARNMVLKIGNFPIFYFPYFSHNLKDESFPLEITPGRSSEWGSYVLSRLRYDLNRQNRGKLIFDWYQDRGKGVGLTHGAKSKKYGESFLRYYRIRDELYRIEKQEEFRNQYPDRDYQELNSNRYKAQFFHNWQPVDRFSLISQFNKFSDQYFMKDFFQREYDAQPEPESYLLAAYSLDNSSLSLLAQKRVNRFFSENEYLPQLEYDFYRQQLGDSRFYFQSLDKIGSLRKTQSSSGETSDAFRIYSDRVLSYRDRIGWLNLTPYAGAHTAFYSRNKLGERSILRTAPKIGATLNTSLYKTFSGSWSFFGQDFSQMRHILTPQIDYKNVFRPSDPNDQIYQFDEHDDIKRKQLISFTLDNKLQAKNEERVWDLLYFSPSVEYSLSREGRRGGRFESVSADLEVYPASNISFNSEFKYDLPENQLEKINADITFYSRQKVEIDKQIETTQKPRYRVSLGHRYSPDDSSQGTLDATYNLTPKLRFKNYLRYKHSTGNLEKQQYSLRFDLHCWWMDFGVDLKRHQKGGRDTTIWMAFTLKAFPRLAADFSQTFDGARSSY